MSDNIDLSSAQKRIAKAKARARPELKVDKTIDEWTSNGYATRLNFDLKEVALRDLVERVDVSTTSNEDFVLNYEEKFRPVVLTNVTKSWPAHSKWTFDYFLKRYKNHKFKCGEDDFGYNVKLKFKYFYHYMRTNDDDSPLYLFDGNFGEHHVKKRLLNDYMLPKYFEEDLFKYVGDDRRPPHRWIVIGSPRSGTGVHIDPLGTSAWNALLVGNKRWCLFPTSTPAGLLKIPQSSGDKQSHEAIQWFRNIYPLVKQSTWPEEYKPVEILQCPGETVFVPSGWWHVVLNLTDTIAITQNFVSSTNFPIVWHKTARSRPKLSKRWLAQLTTEHPDLASVARGIDINTPIGFNSDSSSGWSCSSSSSSDSYCDCSSCSSTDTDDSGKASLSNDAKVRQRKKAKT